MLLQKRGKGGMLELSASGGERMKEKESVLRRYREEKGLSQRQLSHLVRISRGRLRRLEEGRGFEQATYEELKRLCSALGIEFDEILRSEGGEKEKVFLRRAGESSFFLEVGGSGYRIVSLLPRCEELFVGKIFLAPKGKIAANESPRSKKILLTVLIGGFRAEYLRQSYELNAGDSLLFDGTFPYLLENPLLRESVCFLMAVPGFVLTEPPFHSSPSR